MQEYKSDIIITGAGPAGCAAALAARRMEAKVLLLEKAPIPGGTPVCARVHSMLTFHGKKGHRIVGGIPQEIIDNLKKAGGTFGHIRDTVGVAYSVTPVDPDRLALVLIRMLEEEGVNYFPGARFLEAKTRSNRVVEIRGMNAGGFFKARAPVFIDATGSGKLAASAGVPSLDDGEGVMPATLIFQVRDVNMRIVLDYVKNNPGQFHHQTLFDHLRHSPAPGISGFFSIWDEANLSIPRDRLLFYSTINPGEVAINSTRITSFDPLDPKSYNLACRVGRRQVYEIYRFLVEKVPGFSHCKISCIAAFPGIREARRIKGKYVLTAEDLAGGRRFEDEIALGGFPVDLHLSSGRGLKTDELGGEGFYGIPYRCLLPDGISNLLIVGKCFSAESEAHSSARVQATSMAMGQAAGAAAAIAVKRKKEPEAVMVARLRKAVTDLGGILQPDRKEDLP